MTTPPSLRERITQIEPIAVCISCGSDDISSEWKEDVLAAIDELVKDKIESSTNIMIFCPMCESWFNDVAWECHNEKTGHKAQKGDIFISREDVLTLLVGGKKETKE